MITDSEAFLPGIVCIVLKKHLIAFIWHPPFIHISFTQLAFQSEIRCILCLDIMQIICFQHKASSLCFFLVMPLVGRVYENRTFFAYFFLFLFFFPSLFLKAASDHYLIGNNITVAVLGIVIPIGE